MFGEGRPEEMLVGALALVMAGLLAKRIVDGLRSGEIPLYRTRISRAEAGDAKFFGLVGLNAAGIALLLYIAADLLLDWRPF